VVKYGFPTKFVNIIKAFYKGNNLRIVHQGTLTDKFESNTGLKQGCTLSPTLFLIIMDWIMRKTTRGKTGIQWNVFQQLEDLEFADCVCLLSHKHEHMEQKTNSMRNPKNLD
jgi:hypothetical protein